MIEFYYKATGTSDQKRLGVLVFALKDN